MQLSSASTQSSSQHFKACTNTTTSTNTTSTTDHGLRQARLVYHPLSWLHKFLSQQPDIDSPRTREAVRKYAKELAFAEPGSECYDYEGLKIVQQIRSTKGHTTSTDSTFTEAENKEFFSSMQSVFELLDLVYSVLPASAASTTSNAVDQLDDFLKKNPLVLGKNGLDVTDTKPLREKVQLLALCATCEQQGFETDGTTTKPISLDSLCSVLRCTDSVKEVEELVMKACHYGVLSAKIDQTQNILSVHTVLKTRFSKKEWQSLSKRLNYWIEKVNDFESEIAAAKVGGA